MTRDELKAELIAAIQTVRPTDATPVPAEVLAESVLFVIAEHVWSGIVYETPNPAGGAEPVYEFQTWRGRSDDLFVQLMRAQGAQT